MQRLSNLAFNYICVLSLCLRRLSAYDPHTGKTYEDISPKHIPHSISARHFVVKNTVTTLPSRTWLLSLTKRKDSCVVVELSGSLLQNVLDLLSLPSL